MTSPIKDSTYRQLNIQDMISWSLDKKINHALKRIQEFYSVQDGKVYVAFSGGKDSTVLLHLVRSLYPDVIAVFVNTTNEYKEILDFVKLVPNVLTIHPKMTFIQTVEKFGFPLVSKKVARMITDLRENKSTTPNIRNLYLTGFNRKGVYVPSFKLAKKWYPLFQEAKFDITNKCCDILKKEPFHRYEKETGLSAFVGTMVDDGSTRRLDWVKNGCNIYGKKNVSRPLSIWTEKDIWEYIERFSVSYSNIYKDIKDKDGNVLIEGEKRTGCAYCAFGAEQEKSDLINKNRFERLKFRKPKQYEKMMQLKNNGISFSDALFFIRVNH